MSIIISFIRLFFRIFIYIFIHFFRFLQTVGSRGKCLNIPLAQGMDSLNVASALTLILYELRKNILNKQNVKENETLTEN